MDHQKPSAPLYDYNNIDQTKIIYDHAKFKKIYKCYRSNIKSPIHSKLFKKFYKAHTNIYNYLLKFDDTYRPILVHENYNSMLYTLLIKLSYDLKESNNILTITSLSSMIVLLLNNYFNINIDISYLLNYIIGFKSDVNEQDLIEHYKLFLIHKIEETIKHKINTMQYSILLNCLGKKIFN